VSRTFILFVEQGKARPSREVLRLIARRTGKPVEFFAPQSDATDVYAEIPNELLAVAKRLRSFSGAVGLAAGEREALKIVELALRQAARFVRAIQPHADKGAAIVIATLSLAL
jgi:transcriptional regulator with XRE-family HTH domain